MTFPEVVEYCAMEPDFVKQFNRLTDSHLFEDLKRAPIVKMIDEATGYQKELEKKQHEYMQKFISFVWDTVWIRVDLRRD
jgi:hypothetical protein